MHYLKFLIVSLCIGAVSHALAADPPTPASAPTSTSAPVQTSPPTPVSVPPSAETQAAYKPVNHNGTLRYCRSETALGSRFPTSVCGTPEELDFAQQNGKETVQRIQQMNSSLPNAK
jgi:hypothetical protein